MNGRRCGCYIIEDVNGRYRVFLVILILAAVVFGIFLAFRRSAEQVVVISSGETVILKEITTGKRHRYVQGSRWKDLLSRLPFKWFARFKMQTIAFDTTNDVAVAWLMWTGLPSQVYTYTPEYFVTDVRGQKAYLAGDHKIARVSDNTFIDGRALIAPQQGRTMRLSLHRLDSNGHPVCVAEFKIPKPRRKSGPALQPEPLPIRRTHGKTEFTLTKLVTEKNIWTNRGFSGPLTHMFVRVAEDGLPSTNWRLSKLHMSDAAGNQCWHQVASRQNTRGKEYFGGSTLLFPDEPAWKLTLEFQHRGDSSRETPVLEMVVRPQVTDQWVGPNSE